MRLATILNGRNSPVHPDTARNRSSRTYLTWFSSRLLFLRFSFGLLVEAELFDALAAVFFQVGQQSFIREIKRVGVLPIVVHYIVQAIDNMLVAHFDCQLATAIEAAGRQVDRTDNSPLSIGQQHFCM